MAEIVHRIPWKTPYGFTEVKMDTETDGELDDGAAARYVAYALTMQDTHIAMFGIGKFEDDGGLSQAAQAAFPQQQAPPPGVPQMGQQPTYTPTGYASPAQADQACPQCGGPLLQAKQTSRGPVRECAQANGRCVNAKGYPSSVWMTQGRR
jgi:hypothetical protein